jgi:hypothetical protein
MDVQSWTNFTANISPAAVIKQIDRGMRYCLTKVWSDQPVLVIHWVEAPGGRFGCHWDIEIAPAPAGHCRR